FGVAARRSWAHPLQVSGPNPCAALSWLISACCVELTTAAGLAGGRDAAGAAAGGAGAAVRSGLGVGGRTLCGGSGAGSLAPIVGPAACRGAVSAGEAV